MPAEPMKSKFVHHLSSVVRVAIIPVPIGQISVKFQLLLALGHTPRLWMFEKKTAFPNFSQFCFVFVNLGPYGSKNFKTLVLIQINFESVEAFSEFASQWSSQKYIFVFFWKLSLRFLTFFFRKFQIHHMILPYCKWAEIGHMLLFKH